MSTGSLLALAAAVLGVAAALYVLARRRRWRPFGGPPAPDPAGREEAWDAKRGLRRLTGSLSGIEDLYRRLGFSLTTERECERLLGELAAQIHVEIPDYARFRKALADVRSPRAADPDADPLQAARVQRRNDPLLEAIFAVEDDPAEVLRVLNRDPLGTALPFVEQIPVRRSGKIVWRTPMEISVLRKGPRDPERFARLLAELRRRVLDARLRRPESDREAVLEAVARCERDLERDNAYFPTAMSDLEAKLAAWLAGPQAEAARRRRQLEELLVRLAEQRHLSTPEGPAAVALEPAAAGAFGDEVRALADRYLRAPWMQIPALTACLLSLLLAAELAPFSVRQRRAAASAGGMLSRICAETASGHYDGVETIRRLHKLEAKGVFVHSLIFALLRLHGSGGGH